MRMSGWMGGGQGERESRERDREEMRKGNIGWNVKQTKTPNK